LTKLNTAGSSISPVKRNLQEYLEEFESELKSVKRMRCEDCSMVRTDVWKKEEHIAGNMETKVSIETTATAEATAMKATRSPLIKEERRGRKAVAKVERSVATQAIQVQKVEPTPDNNEVTPSGKHARIKIKIEAETILEHKIKVEVAPNSDRTLSNSAPKAVGVSSQEVARRSRSSGRSGAGTGAGTGTDEPSAAAHTGSRVSLRKEEVDLSVAESKETS
jgi:hypothetical protein